MYSIVEPRQRSSNQPDRNNSKTPLSPAIFGHFTRQHSCPCVPNAKCVLVRPCGGFCSPPRLLAQVFALASLPWIQNPTQAISPAQRGLARAPFRARKRRVHEVGTRVQRGVLVVWMLDLRDERSDFCSALGPMRCTLYPQSSRYPVDRQLDSKSGSLVQLVQMLNGWNLEQLWSRTCFGC